MFARAWRFLGGRQALVRGWLGGSVLTLLASGFAVAQKPLSLHDAIEQAMQSPAARVAEEQVNVSRGVLRQAGLGPNPQLYLQSEDIHPWDSNFSFPNGTEDYGYVGQMFELGGKRGRRVAVADANLHRAESERLVRLAVISGRVAGAYWSAAVASRVRDLLGEDLAAMDRMVVYHRERVDAGAMRGVDLLRMEIERDRVDMALLTAMREAELTRIELYRQIGRPVPAGGQLMLADSITSTEAPAAATVEEVLAQRADLVSAREAVVAARADVALQKANGVPDLDLLAGYKRNSGTDTLYTSLNMPLPFRNRNQGGVLQAQANLRGAEAALMQVELSARAEIQAAQEDFGREQEIVQKVLPTMQERAAENLKILEEAYRTGGIDLLRYLDAERTQIDVQVTALRTLAEFHQSALRLQLAQGQRP